MRRIIYLSLICLFCLFFAVGCASLRRDIAAYEACQADADCLAKAQSFASGVRSSVTAVASAVPGTAPIAYYIGSGFGMLATLFAGVKYGRKKKKEV